MYINEFKEISSFSFVLLINISLNESFIANFISKKYAILVHFILVCEKISKTTQKRRLSYLKKATKLAQNRKD